MQLEPPQEVMLISTVTGTTTAQTTARSSIFTTSRSSLSQNHHISSYHLIPPPSNPFIPNHLPFNPSTIHQPFYAASTEFWKEARMQPVPDMCSLLKPCFCAHGGHGDECTGKVFKPYSSERAAIFCYLFFFIYTDKPRCPSPASLSRDTNLAAASFRVACSPRVGLGHGVRPA